jgi:CBS domain-containing protein
MSSEPLSAGDVCTRVVAIAFRSTSVTEAARVMREQHVGCLIVVDDTPSGRRLAGLLTDRDIVTAVVAHGLDVRTLRVEDVMTTDVATAGEADSILDVTQTMRRKGVRRVPVVDAQGGLIGVVAFDDVIEIIAEQMQLLARAVGRERQREESMRPTPDRS